MLKEGEGDERFLAVLIVIAIVISVFGTFFSLSMIGELDLYKQYMAGYGTSGSGQINISITQAVNITMMVYNMSFGTGQIVNGRAHATLNSTTKTPTITTTMLASANWTNSTAVNPASMRIRNDGNVNVSLNLTSSVTPTAFLGGTGANFEFNASEAQALSCVNNLADWTVIDGNTQEVCRNLGAADTKDELYVDARLTVPYDTQGNREAFWTFSAVAEV